MCICIFMVVCIYVRVCLISFEYFTFIIVRFWLFVVRFRNVCLRLAMFCNVRLELVTFMFWFGNFGEDQLGLATFSTLV